MLPKVHPLGSERPYGRPKRPRGPGGKSRYFTLWTCPPNMGVCAAMHGHPPQRGAPRASTRASVAPSGQAGPVGSFGHGPAPGGPCAGRFGVGRCPRGQKGQNWPKTRFFEVSGQEKGPMVAFGGFLDTFWGLLGDGEARGTQKHFAQKRILLACVPEKYVFEQNIFSSAELPHHLKDPKRCPESPQTPP